MTNLYCYKCGKLVATLVVGSKIRKGSVVYCSRKCVAPKPYTDAPDLLKDLFGLK